MAALTGGAGGPSRAELPDPDLGPQRINVHQYHAWAPEKFELLDGFLFYGPEDRRRLLKLLLVNLGLLDAVTVVPKERWLEALERVYGSGGRQGT